MVRQVLVESQAAAITGFEALGLVPVAFGSTSPPRAHLRMTGLRFVLSQVRGSKGREFTVSQLFGFGGCARDRWQHWYRTRRTT